ncbi:uncharacterized protein [Drosophila bipectinata]|uniref:uncharacterized protein n=1 Tax=Drosophila bipectinata TaxID=42026 RepID=UPI0007E81020|nr:uncharacterized protein LOC108120648 [Drosophila bipectinata]
MFFAKSSAIFAIIFVQLLAFIQGGVYNNQDKWVLMDKNSDLPENAVFGGINPDNYYSYVGRTAYSSSILPARVVPELGKATFNTETSSFDATSFEVLVANETISYHWKRSFDGFREENAVSVGTNSANERVFICRARSNDAHIIGTLVMTQRSCIIKYNTLPVRYHDKYEILVRERNLGKWP